MSSCPLAIALGLIGNVIILTRILVGVDSFPCFAAMTKLTAHLFSMPHCQHSYLHKFAKVHSNSIMYMLLRKLKNHTVTDTLKQQFNFIIFNNCIRSKVLIRILFRVSLGLPIYIALLSKCIESNSVSDVTESTVNYYTQ